MLIFKLNCHEDELITKPTQNWCKATLGPFLTHILHLLASYVSVAITKKSLVLRMN